MGRRKFKYPGDAAFKALLHRYRCPTPFQVVRMRFVGWTASEALAASPLPVIEALWPDGLPVFADEREASRFFEAFFGLVNHVSRHQDGVRVKMSRLPKPRCGEDFVRAFRTRADEIRDGFLVGYRGDGGEREPPEQLREPLASLEKLVEEFGGLADGVSTDGSADEATLTAYGRILDLTTDVAELQLTNLILSAKVLRAAELGAGLWRDRVR